MSFDISISAKAYKEYYDAYEWYESELPGLGDRFEDSLEKLIAIVAKSPLIFPGKSHGTRECKVDGFPYLIVYKIFSVKKVILIVSIFHTSRNPQKKYKKQ
jgi:plasmid stabilization system protein ParE